MRNKKLKYISFFTLLIALIVGIFTINQNQRDISISFYHWKSEFSPSNHDLKLLQEEYARLAFEHEEGATWTNISQEESLRNALVQAKLALNAARTDLVVQREQAQSGAAMVVSAAQKNARDKTHDSWSWTTSIEHISG